MVLTLYLLLYFFIEGHFNGINFSQFFFVKIFNKLCIAKDSEKVEKLMKILIRNDQVIKFIYIDPLDS